MPETAAPFSSAAPAGAAGPVSLTDQLRFVERELAARRISGPFFVARGLMTPAEAEHEIRCAEAVHATLKRLRGDA